MIRETSWGERGRRGGGEGGGEGDTCRREKEVWMRETSECVCVGGGGGEM